MTIDINELREHYAALTDDELRNLVITGGLTREAQELLDIEMRSRGIQDVSEYREHLANYDRQQHEEKQRRLARQEAKIRRQRRVGDWICVLGVSGGLFDWLLLGHKTNGIGILIASALMFPLFRVLTWARRLAFRFMLRS
jgi:hypothetical protein